MVKEWFFNILALFFITSISAQKDAIEEDFKDQGLSLKVQALILFPYQDIRNGGVYETEFELEDNSFIYGFNSELNYYFNSNFGLGLGVGYEKLSQPNLLYYPLYLNIIGVLNETKNAIYFKANFGGHLGDLDKSGFIFRGGVGYRLKVFKNILSNFEFVYSYQNIYKSFADSERPENYYNIESVGLTVGIEFN